MASEEKTLNSEYLLIPVTASILNDVLEFSDERTEELSLYRIPERRSVAEGCVLEAKGIARSINDKIEAFNRATDLEDKKEIQREIEERFRAFDNKYQSGLLNGFSAYQALKREVYQQIVRLKEGPFIDSSLPQAVQDFQKMNELEQRELYFFCTSGLNKKRQDSYELNRQSLYPELEAPPTKPQKVQDFIDRYQLQSLSSGFTTLIKANCEPSFVMRFEPTARLGSRTFELSLRDTSFGKYLLRPDFEEHQWNEKNNMGNTSLVQVMPYFEKGSVYEQIKTTLEGNDPVNLHYRTSDYFLQMSQVFIQARESGTYFQDGKNRNFLIKDNGQLTIADLIGFQPESSEGRYSHHRESRGDPFEKPETCSTHLHLPEDDGQSDYDIDKAHAFILGKNLYQFLSGRDDSYLKNKDSLTEKDFNSPSFRGQQGLLFKNLISALVKENPEDRISVSEAQRRLASIVLPLDARSTLGSLLRSLDISDDNQNTMMAVFAQASLKEPLPDSVFSLSPTIQASLKELSIRASKLPLPMSELHQEMAKIMLSKENQDEKVSSLSNRITSLESNAQTIQQLELTESVNRQLNLKLLLKTPTIELPALDETEEQAIKEAASRLSTAKAVDTQVVEFLEEALLEKPINLEKLLEKVEQQEEVFMSLERLDGYLRFLDLEPHSQDKNDYAEYKKREILIASPELQLEMLGQLEKSIAKCKYNMVNDLVERAVACELGDDKKNREEFYTGKKRDILSVGTEAYGTDINQLRSEVELREAVDRLIKRLEDSYTGGKKAEKIKLALQKMSVNEQVEQLSVILSGNGNVPQTKNGQALLRALMTHRFSFEVEINYNDKNAKLPDDSELPTSFKELRRAYQEIKEDEQSRASSLSKSPTNSMDGQTDSEGWSFDEDDKGSLSRSSSP